MRIISPLPMDKVDLIRSQVGVDWSKEIVEGATFEDLDPEAVPYAKLYVAESTFHIIIPIGELANQRTIIL